MSESATSHGCKLPFTYNLVDGLIVPNYFMQNKVNELKEKLILCQGDVVINTYPKAGTTWVQQICKLLRNGGKEDGMKVFEAIPWLEVTALQYGPPSISLDSLTRPFYLKSHMPYELTLGGLPHLTKAKYIYVARNPKDVAVSYFHHMRGVKIYEFVGSWDEYFSLYLTGRICFGSWFDHVLGWWEHKDTENILFLKYEELKSNLHEGVLRIAKFLRDDVPPASVINQVVEQCSFERMKTNPAVDFSWIPRNLDQPPFIRKGEVGDWRNYFTDEQNTVFDALYAEQMKDSGLDFEFY